jgi:excisionase family DNA binding protein
MINPRPSTEAYMLTDDMPGTRPGLLSTSTVAERLNVRPDHVVKLIHAGQLGAVDIGVSRGRPSYRVPSDSLAQFLEERSSRGGGVGGR